MEFEEGNFAIDLNKKRFDELRSGFWDVVFHTDIDIFAKRAFATYYRSADQYVVENGGDSTIRLFNDTCRDCGYTSLIQE